MRCSPSSRSMEKHIHLTGQTVLGEHVWPPWGGSWAALQCPQHLQPLQPAEPTSLQCCSPGWPGASSPRCAAPSRPAPGCRGVNGFQQACLFQQQGRKLIIACGLWKTRGGICGSWKFSRMKKKEGGKEQHRHKGSNSKQGKRGRL